MFRARLDRAMIKVPPETYLQCRLSRQSCNSVSSTPGHFKERYRSRQNPRGFMKPLPGRVMAWLGKVHRSPESPSPVHSWDRAKCPASSVTMRQGEKECGDRREGEDAFHSQRVTAVHGKWGIWSWIMRSSQSSGGNRVKTSAPRVGEAFPEPITHATSKQWLPQLPGCLFLFIYGTLLVFSYSISAATIHHLGGN